MSRDINDSAQSSSTNDPTESPLWAAAYAAPHATSKGAQDTAAANGAACPAHPDYEGMINIAARNIYSPDQLGNIQALKNKYNCDIHSPADAIAKAKEALKATGDKYDTVLTAKEWAMLQEDMNGSLSGVGLQLRERKDAAGNISTEVLNPVANSPAAAAGLQRGDLIEKVNGNDVTHLGPADVAPLIRNPAGTPVDITVLRNGHEIPNHLTTTDYQAPPAVDGPKDVGNGIAYISINAFVQNDTYDQLRQALEKAKDAKGLIIDVRDNGGGLVQQSLLSAEFFIKNGSNMMNEVRRVDSDPQHPKYQTIRHDVDAKWRDVPEMDNGRPIVVLTNGDTASAAEIFTGAMHDTAHAETIGTQTFGKGIGQGFIPGPDHTMIKVTDLHYKTPSGHWPGDAANHKDGLVPNEVVPMDPDVELGSANDKQLTAAVAFLQRKFAGGAH